LSSANFFMSSNLASSSAIGFSNSNKVLIEVYL
jgi:hypothetical protein